MFLCPCPARQPSSVPGTPRGGSLGLPKRLGLAAVVAAAACGVAAVRPTAAEGDGLGPDFPTTLDRTWAGRDAGRWAARLADADPRISRGAVVPLAGLGDEAPRFVVAAAESPHAHVRVNACRCFPSDDLSRYAARLAPPLRKLLKDADPAVRREAAQVVCCGRLDDLAGDVRSALESEANPAVRESMRIYMHLLSAGR